MDWNVMPPDTDGVIHQERFILKPEKAALMEWLETLHPLWEHRHGDERGLRQGQKRRRLLRPVYWLGGWQFACLNYYNPPDYIHDRVVEAEPFPDVLSAIVARVEARALATFRPEDVPPGWCLNTCLINLYGLVRRGERWVDVGRVGGHHDSEPGPVASLSLGARARFQFATKARGHEEENIVLEHWLKDRSLLVFASPRWKKEVFHRVPRVARQDQYVFDLPVEDFRIRRVNFTLRYVPPEHIVPFSQLAAPARSKVEGYVRTLAESAPFYARALDVNANGS